jgi:hypothetical protein
MLYYCEYCNVNCRSNYIFEKHIATKKHLKNVQIATDTEPVDKLDHTCTICNKTYTKYGHYTNHVAKCKRKISSGLVSSGVPINAVSKVLATIDNNLSLTPHGSQQVGNNNTIVTNNNTQRAKNIHNGNRIHNTQNIYITPFGKEDISMICDAKQREIIEHEKRAFEFLLKELYAHKTNYNIFISDKRNGLVKYLNADNKLQVGQLNDMLGEMVENHKKILDDFIDKFSASFKGSVPDRLQELKDDHECGERDDKYKKLSKRKLLEISEVAKTLMF